jgi:hypothetical protein
MMLLLDLFESRSSIVALGYPDVIARLFYKRFPKHAYLIARWYKDYTRVTENDWFDNSHSTVSRIGILELIKLYNATDSVENFQNVQKELNIVVDRTPDLTEMKAWLFNELADKFFNQTFFDYYSLINDITSGQLTDINPYKNLTFDQALEKYEHRKVFADTKPIKTYANGWKWIDVGPKCMFLGKAMKNCGSVGIMSDDPNRTILALFDANNTPHVMLTYQPNKGEIKSVQGGAGRDVKEQYFNYVIDLIKTLDVKLDLSHYTPPLMKTRYLVGDIARDIKVIAQNMHDIIIGFRIGNTQWYTNGHSVVSQQDLAKLKTALEQGTVKREELSGGHGPNPIVNLLEMLLHYRNDRILAMLGVNKLQLEQEFLRLFKS